MYKRSRTFRIFFRQKIFHKIFQSLIQKAQTLLLHSFIFVSGAFPLYESYAN